MIANTQSSDRSHSPSSRMPVIAVLRPPSTVSDTLTRKITAATKMPYFTQSGCSRNSRPPWMPKR